MYGMSRSVYVIRKFQLGPTKHSMLVRGSRYLVVAAIVFGVGAFLLTPDYYRDPHDPRSTSLHDAEVPYVIFTIPRSIIKNYRCF